MALLDNGAQINTIMLRYISDHLLQVGSKPPSWGWALPTQDHWATF